MFEVGTHYLRREFIDDREVNTTELIAVSEDDETYRFKSASNDDAHYTVAKTSFPEYNHKINSDSIRRIEIIKILD